MGFGLGRHETCGWSRRNFSLQFQLKLAIVFPWLTGCFYKQNFTFYLQLQFVITIKVKHNVHILFVVKVQKREWRNTEEKKLGIKTNQKREKREKWSVSSQTGFPNFLSTAKLNELPLLFAGFKT